MVENQTSRDSILMDRAIRKILEKYNLKVTVEEVLRRPTLRNLAKFFEGDLQFVEMSQELITEDINFKGSWVPEFVERQLAPKTLQAVLLTGGTGFLGSHIIKDLLESTTAKIFVLVRTTDSFNAKTILMNSALKFKLDISGNERIIPVVGDLSKPLLGMQQQQFDILSHEIDAVYHAGSFVHHIYDYQTLRTTNVLGTSELLKFAMTNKKKFFNYISSVVGVLEKDVNGLLLEDFPELNYCTEIDGYSQTKWVSEKLVTQAKELGLPVTIFRPCNITGRSTDGASSPEKDHVLNLIKGCIQMGLAPDWPIELNFMPVDYVSANIVTASQQAFSTNKVFNIVNPNPLPWKQLIDWLNEYGYPIKIIPEEEWSQIHLPKIKKDNALFHLASLYTSEPGIDNQNDLYTIYRYHSDNASRVFDTLKISPPVIDANLLKKYFEYFHLCNFIDKPKTKIK